MLNIIMKNGKVIEVYEDAEPDSEGIATLKEGQDYVVKGDDQP